MEKPVLAIISPCYNEEEILKITFEKLNNILQNLKDKEKISTESFISFVDDGSTDKTWDSIKEFNASGIKLSKNFGHQSALLAGLIENKADIYITLDADLQDDINIIEKMIDKYTEGYEIVYGFRNDRSNDTFLKRTLTAAYYKLTKIFKMQTIYNHGDFRLLSDKIVDLLRQNTEVNLYLRGIIPNFGFKNTCIFYKRQKRIGGKAKYNYFSLTKLAIDGITSFSVIPLRIIFILGCICLLTALLLSLILIIWVFINKINLKWEFLIISLYFLGAIQLISIGILGEYIGKIYFEIKRRPQFIVENKTSKS